MKILIIAVLLALSGCDYNALAVDCVRRGGAIIRIAESYVCAKVEIIDTNAPPHEAGKK